MAFRSLRTAATLIAAATLVVVSLGSYSKRLPAQEQVDQLDRAKRAAAAIAELSLRVRVTRLEPAANSFLIDWRRGGEGLGGTVTRGTFTPAADAPAPEATQEGEA